MSTDTTPTPESQQAAEPAPDDKPSWHGPIAALQQSDAQQNARLAAIEATLPTIVAGIKTINDGMGLQNVVLGEIKGALKSPWVRQVLLVTVGLIYLRYRPWLLAHGIKIPFLEPEDK